MEEKYYEIGEKFSLEGETYETKEDTGESCERCAFRNECQNNLQCGSNERKDGKDVYFKKVENMELGEEQIPAGIIGSEDAKINVDDIKPCTAVESLKSSLDTAIKLFENRTGIKVQTISGNTRTGYHDDPDEIEWIITTKLE